MADTTEMPVETKPVNPHVATTCTAGPIGLTAFGITTILLNFLNAELIGKDTITLIICYGMFHGGMIQILAGMWEVYRGNIFGGLPERRVSLFTVTFSEGPRAWEAQGRSHEEVAALCKDILMCQDSFAPEAEQIGPTLYSC